ncbi:MAG: SUMF1/EgtB/PvdO family nonheme iron enzyme [Flavobacteriales bacterium]|jgi:gliding motility-associated lipoprotein GldJ
MKRSIFTKISYALFAAGLLASCQKETSTSTGWEYNNINNGGFEKADFEEQRTGPGLVMIEGGTFTMGRTEEDVFDDNNNRPNRFTVSSFYMDRTEVTNFHWLEYVYWMKRVYYKTYPHIYKKALPDTLCWRDPLSYREKFVEYYFRYPAYRDYPVVGVSWIQANDFCKWRTDRVNEYILVEQGIIKWHFADKIEDGGDLGTLGPESKDAKKSQNAPENMFNTESYLAGQYNIESGTVKKDDPKNYKYSGKGYTLTDGKVTTPKEGESYPRDPYMLNNYDPVYAVNDEDNYYQGKRLVRLEDGILLPKYRLPTEAEWEYAALGLLGNLDPKSENIDERRIYPWDGHYVRYDEEQFQGTIQANFVRGTGDHMGVAGALNDGADATTYVDAYWPNDFGLYNMAGNVSEWVMDTYRPTTSDLADGFMPFRGNVYQTPLMVPDGLHDKYVKTKDNIYDVHGMKEFVNEYARVLYARHGNIELNLDKNYKANYITQLEKERRDKESVSAPLFISAIDLVETTDSLRLISKFNGADSVVSRQWKVEGPGKVTYAYDSLTKKTSDQSASALVNFSTPGKYTVSLTVTTSKGAKESKVLTDYITVLDKSQKAYINSQRQKAMINSRQDMRKYQFNSPSNYYTSNGRKLTSQDKAQLEVLDELNSLIDTAIFLYNKGNTVKASAFIEKSLFGNTPMTKLLNSDFRNEADMTELNKNGEDVKSGDQAKDFGIYLQKPVEGEDPECKWTYAFGNDYLDFKFPQYKDDQTITTWLLNLRNGLSEYTIESRGKQRWRNVTEEENIGRLNYRKDDYIDYLDGDLESSIYYNNTKRKEDINSGRLSAKNTVYQSQHENLDLNNDRITSNSSGWPTTLISDRSKVYKGGSWADRAYWLSAGNRRFLDEDKSSATIGFRCAMDRLGGQPNLNYKKRKRN